MRLAETPRCPGLDRSRWAPSVIALGPEAAEPIDEFLAQALAFERSQPPALEAFLGQGRNEQADIGTGFAELEAVLKSGQSEGQRR